MITLVQLPPAFGLPVSVSPYCTKLETYFRLTGREYKTTTDGLRKSPNKRVPYVVWRQGEVLADSAAIISRCESEGPALDEGLPADEGKSAAVLVERVEAILYYACLYARFGEPDGWVHQKPLVRGLVPGLLAPILVPVIRGSQVKACRVNGFSPGSGGYPRALEVVQEIETLLTDRSFVTGDEIRTADCAVWANVMHSAHTLASNPVRDAVRASRTLADYIARVAERARFELPAPG